MKVLLKAILDDDPAKVGDLIQRDPSLPRARLSEAILYRSGIHHWLYVNDTALHLAAAGHRVEIVGMLLAAGADANAAANHRRGRPLHYAADGCPGQPWFDAGRQVKTIGRLLEAGAEIHAADKNGATALHRAVRTRCAAAVAYLLKAGADPTARNHPGATAFHLAVQNTGRGGSGDEAARVGQRQIIEAMLAHGLSVSLRDGRGLSVLDWAKSGWIRELLSNKR